MTKLSKIFETKKGDLLVVYCDYDEKSNMIGDISVSAMNRFWKIDLTELFETVPQLSDLVDDIAWREIYREKEVRHA